VNPLTRKPVHSAESEHSNKPICRCDLRRTGREWVAYTEKNWSCADDALEWHAAGRDDAPSAGKGIRLCAGELNTIFLIAPPAPLSPQLRFQFQ